MDWFKGKNLQETIDFPIEYGVFLSFSMYKLKKSSAKRGPFKTTAEFGPAGSLDEQHGVGRTHSAGVRLGDATGRWGEIFNGRETLT